MSRLLAAALIAATGCAERALPITAPEDLGVPADLRPTVDLAMTGPPDLTLPPLLGPPLTVPAMPGDMVFSTSIADVDGDGRQDVVMSVDTPAAPRSQLVVLLGRGDGTFTQVPRALLPFPTPMVDVRTGDFDGDGKADLFTRGLFFRSLGGGVFDLAHGIPFATDDAGAPDFSAIGVIDWDGDGISDLFTCGGTGIRLWHGAKTLPPISAGSYTTPSGYMIVGCSLGDLDGDKHPDVLTYEESATDIHLRALFVSAGAITAGPITTPAPDYHTLLHLNDVDEDGNRDVLITDNSNLVISRGQGGGHFGPFVTNPLHLPLLGVIVDLDGDGHADLLGSDPMGAPNSVIVAFGDGKGTFPSEIVLPITAGGRVFTQDLGGSKRFDLMVVPGDGLLTLYLNQR